MSVTTAVLKLQEALHKYVEGGSRRLILVMNLFRASYKYVHEEIFVNCLGRSYFVRRTGFRWRACLCVYANAVSKDKLAAQVSGDR